MQATVFQSVDVSGRSGDAAWSQLFQSFWPAYRAWFVGKKGAAVNRDELTLAQAKLAAHMPELLPIYQRLVALTGHDPVAAQFLTMYRPPAYLVNCSQAVLNAENGCAPMLIRNYDLSPDLSENTITHSDWLGLRVIATNECLWGADDGMNDAGLAISLTFGGSRTVGDGFGIPLIMRYVLHTCTTVAQAVAVLERVPSHMAYNVTVLDKTGAFATVLVGAGGGVEVTQQRAITNHQSQVVWTEQARFSKTIERKNFLDDLLQQPSCDSDALVHAFLSPPLRSTNFAQSFGTVYTAVYRPESGEMSYEWCNQRWSHGFADFKNSSISVDLLAGSVADHSQAIDLSTHFNYSFDMKGILENMLVHISPELTPNLQAMDELQRNSQASDYDWIRFANDFAKVWTYPATPQRMNDVTAEPEQAMVQSAQEANPSVISKRIRRLAYAFH